MRRRHCWENRCVRQGPGTGSRAGSRIRSSGESWDRLRQTGSFTPSAAKFADLTLVGLDLGTFLAIFDHQVSLSGWTHSCVPPPVSWLLPGFPSILCCHDSHWLPDSLWPLGRIAGQKFPRVIGQRKSFFNKSLQGCGVQSLSQQHRVASFTSLLHALSPTTLPKVQSTQMSQSSCRIDSIISLFVGLAGEPLMSSNSFF